jgi:aspartate/methionine/tyrosine aminotransferase
MILSEAANRLTGQPMFKLMDEIRRREAAGQDFVHFEIGDPDFNSPLIAKAQLVDAMIKNKTHYSSSQGLLALREEIADFHGRINNFTKPIKASQVVIAPGCNPLIYAVLKCICAQGLTVGVPDPGFPTYESICNLLNLPRVYQEIGDVHIINSPSNPKGYVECYGTLKTFAKIANLYNHFIVSDEIYQLVTYNGSPAPSISAFDQEFKNTAVISGYSKAFSMAGWRIGYMISNEELCEKVTLLLQSIISATCTFTQHACLGLLKQFPQEYFENMEELRKRRDLLVNGLNSIHGVSCPMPEGATYVFPNIQETGRNSSEVTQLLLDCGVAVLPGSDFGSAGEGHIRLAYCTSQEKIKQGIERIKKALS